MIKEKAKPNKKEVSKAEAEKILKEANNQDLGEDKKVETKDASKKKPSTKTTKSKSEIKKVSKK